MKHPLEISRSGKLIEQYPPFNSAQLKILMDLFDKGLVSKATILKRILSQ